MPRTDREPHGLDFLELDGGRECGGLAAEFSRCGVQEFELVQEWLEGG